MRVLAIGDLHTETELLDGALAIAGDVDWRLCEVGRPITIHSAEPRGVEPVGR